MVIVGLLVGVSFQESSKKLPFSDAPAGVHLESIIQLALVHGHVFTMGVLLPLAAASLALHLYKGYHVLLMARAGERDLAVIDAAFMGGSHLARLGIYALVHAGMGVTLGVFVVLLWRSLKR